MAHPTGGTCSTCVWYDSSVCKLNPKTTTYDPDARDIRHDYTAMGSSDYCGRHELAANVAAGEGDGKRK